VVVIEILKLLGKCKELKHKCDVVLDVVMKINQQIFSVLIKTN